MVTTRILTLLMAGVMLSTTGCSGSRLRNLVGRSDYAGMDELESQDAVDAEKRKAAEKRKTSVAELAEPERADVLVSQKRELSEQKSDDEATPRKSFFDFAKALNRKAEQDEFSPDPFAEAGDAAGVKVTKTPQKTEFSDEKTSKPKVDNPGGTIAEVEKQAENLFDEAFAGKESLFSEKANDSSTATKKEETEGPHQESFADFIRGQQVTEKQEKVVSKAVPMAVAVNKSEPVKSDKAETSMVTTATASRFDSFLNEVTAGAEKKAESVFSSDLFPELPKDPAKAPEPPKTASAATTPRVAKNPFAESTIAPKPLESSFAEASRKHGFPTGATKDPWAAFDSSRSSSWTADRTVEPISAEQDIAWSDQPVAVEKSDTNPFALMETDATANSADRTRNPPFLQVSSTRPADVRPAMDIRDSAPLFIPHADTPANNPQPPAGDSWSGNELTRQSSTVGSDPFLTSVSLADPAVADAVEVTDPATAAPLAVNKSGGIGQWSRRTWFLLIGCVIVALLLFMPDRHNRTNE